MRSSGLEVFVIPALLLTMALSSPLCLRGVQFWDVDQQSCSNCSSCSPGELVLRPCQPHIDTFCGPLSAMRIDWSWARPQQKTVPPPSPSTLITTTRPVTPRPKPVRKKVITSTTTSSSSTSTTSPIPSTVVVTESVTEPPPTPPPPPPPAPPAQLLPRPLVSAQTFSAEVHKTSNTQDIETLLWDWHTCVLVVALSACALFMMLLAVYAVVQARRAVGRRRDLQRELDEATARLSLFAVRPGELEGAVLQELQTVHRPRAPAASSSPRLYAPSPSSYLEKLLEHKQQRQSLERGNRGNIYVETGRQATPAPARRTSSTRWKPPGKQQGLR